MLLDADTALAATGNPGRLYKIDLKIFATIGLGMYPRDAVVTAPAADAP